MARLHGREHVTGDKFAIDAMTGDEFPHQPHAGDGHVPYLAGIVGPDQLFQSVLSGGDAGQDLCAAATGRAPADLPRFQQVLLVRGCEGCGE